MDQNTKGNGLITNLAEIADKLQNALMGKASVVFELKEGEFNSAVATLSGSVSVEDKFKIEISGTDFIFLLGES